MAEDEAPKSALELAMARLEKKDQDEGVTGRPVTEEQRAAIAEARQVCAARMAEREILYHSKMRVTADPAMRETLENEYRRDRERTTADRDRKIEEIRGR